LDFHEYKKLLRLLERLEAARKKGRGSDRGWPTLADAKRRRKPAEGGRPEGAARDGFRCGWRTISKRASP